MNNKLNLSQLINLEKKNNLWDYKLFEYPIWIHCREPILSSSMMADRKFAKPSIREMASSMLMTIRFLLNQKKYHTIYFLMERAEVLEIYYQDKSKDKLLFLNHEQDKVYAEKDYISSDFFNLLRFVSRKLSYIIFFRKYQEFLKKVNLLGIDAHIHIYIRYAFGDALFLKFLSLVLLQKNKHIYTGCVIPIGEKFVNALNSFEVQHGVIHDTHVGYVAIPQVENNLILYSDKYKTIMKTFGYKGSLLVDNFKDAFLKKPSDRYFPIVIYTQPSPQMQNDIQQFLLRHKPKDVFIQKHPKDYFNYALDDSYLVFGTIPSEVGYPILHTTTVIENFTQINRECYIYSPQDGNYDIKNFLSIYTQKVDELYQIRETFYELYVLIQDNIKANAEC